MKGEGRRAGSALWSRKVLSGCWGGLACASSPEAKNSWAERSARRPSRKFIRRSYSRRRWARRPTAGNQLVKLARLTQLALAAGASEIILQRSLQPPGKQRPSQEDGSAALSDQTGIPLLQTLALEGIEQVDVQPHARRKGEPGAEVEVIVGRQLGVVYPGERVFGEPRTDIVPVGLELKPGHPARRVEQRQVAQSGRNTGKALALETHQAVHPSAQLGLEHRGATHELEPLEW